jgi:hypothetical protein
LRRNSQGRSGTRRAARAGLITALTILSCGGPSPRELKTTVAKDSRGAPLTALSLPEVSPKSTVESTLPVLFATDRAYVDETVERLIPAQIYETKGRALGHGTTLDLVVTRGKPHYEIRADELRLELPLELSLDVKGTLGPFKLHYGRCRPTVLVEAVFPTSLGPELYVPEPSLKTKLEQGCHLAGFDVNPILERELESHRQRAERTLREQLKRSHRLLTERAHELQEDLETTRTVCPHLTLQKLVQSPLIEVDGVLSTSLGVRGIIVNDCGKPPNEPTAVERRDERLRFDLAEQTLFDWSTLLRFIDPILSQHGLLRQPAQLRSANTPQGERIALGISGDKLNGWVFLSTRVEDNHVRFVAREADDPDLLKQIGKLIATVALPVDVTTTERHATQLLQKSIALSRLELSRPELKAKLAITRERLQTSLDTQLTPQGVMLSIHVSEPVLVP